MQHKKSKLSFFPVGNGDMCLIEIAGVGTVLIDINIADNSTACDLVKTLRDKCSKDKYARPYVNVLALTHPDQDHCRGWRDYFYSGPLKDYEKAGPAPDGGKRIIAYELWSSPMVFRRKSKNAELCDDAKEFQKEAKRRVELFRKHGKTDNLGDMITIIGEDEDGKTEGLERILKREGDVFSDINGTQGDIVSIRVLGPFAKQDSDDEEDILCKNDSSMVLQFTFHGERKALFGGDAGVGIWKRLWSKHKGDTPKLEYGFLLAPHHCSWHTMSEDSESECDNPTADKDALNALGQANKKAFIVSSSKAIKNDEDTPPSYRAKKEYEKILEKVGGKFLCVEEETKSRECLEFEIGDEGIRICKKDSGNNGGGTTIAPGVVSTIRPHGELQSIGDDRFTMPIYNPKIFAKYVQRRISFSAEYLGNENLEIYDASIDGNVQDTLKEGKMIRDTFTVEIRSLGLQTFPSIRDCEGRVVRIKEKLGPTVVNNLDGLHLYKDGSFCLFFRGQSPTYIKKYMPNGVLDESLFVREVLIQHLYWLSYCEEYRDQPWPGLPHEDGCAMLQILSDGQYEDKKQFIYAVDSICPHNKPHLAQSIRGLIVSTLPVTQCRFCRNRNTRCVKAIRSLMKVYRNLPH